jgi:hypothetical protein
MKNGGDIVGVEGAVTITGQGGQIGVNVGVEARVGRAVRVNLGVVVGVALIAGGHISVNVDVEVIGVAVIAGGQIGVNVFDGAVFIIVVGVATGD